MYIRTSSSVSAHYNIHAGMLQWFTQPAVAQRVTAGGTPVSVNEVYATAESLPDEAVDAELRRERVSQRWHGFCHINMYVSTWISLLLILYTNEASSPPTVSEQRRQWQCEACLTVATVKSMIACDCCARDRWFHWCGKMHNYTLCVLPKIL